MPARGGEASEQRLAPCFFVEVEALRIELGGELLDGLGGEGDRPQFASLADRDVLEKVHQRGRSGGT